MFPWTGTQGPIINGKLIITNREDVTLKALTLTFKAKISCSWSESTPSFLFLFFRHIVRINSEMEQNARV